MGPQGQGGIEVEANGTTAIKAAVNGKQPSKNEAQFLLCICILGIYNCLLLATFLCVPISEPFSRHGWDIRKWTDDNFWTFILCSNICLIFLYTAFFLSLELTYFINLIFV
jgi:hypothetical protein